MIGKDEVINSAIFDFSIIVIRTGTDRTISPPAIWERYLELHRPARPRVAGPP